MVKTVSDLGKGLLEEMGESRSDERRRAVSSSEYGTVFRLTVRGPSARPHTIRYPDSARIRIALSKSEDCVST